MKLGTALMVVVAACGGDDGQTATPDARAVDAPLVDAPHGGISGSTAFTARFVSAKTYDPTAKDYKSNTRTGMNIRPGSIATTGR